MRWGGLIATATAALTAAAPAFAIDRAALAREALAAVEAAGPDAYLEPHVEADFADLLLSVENCSAAATTLRLADAAVNAFVRNAGKPAARKCLIELSRRWLTAPLTDQAAARRLHVAGALLRIIGREQEGEDAIARATVLLTGPPQFEGLSVPTRLAERFATLFGDQVLWDARVAELRIYQGTPLFASRLAFYASAIGARPRGLAQAEDLARMAIKANRSDLADIFIAVLPTDSSIGSPTLRAGALLVEDGRYQEALHRFAQAGAEDRANLPSYLFPIGGEPERFVEAVDSNWMLQLFPENVERANAYAAQAMFWRIRGRPDRATASVAEAVRILSNFAVPADMLKNIVGEAALVGRNTDAQRLIGRAPADVRAELRTEAAYGAAGAGDWNAFDQWVADGAAADEPRRLTAGLFTRPPTEASRVESFRRVEAMIAKSRDRYALRDLLRSVRAESEYRIGERLLRHEPDADARIEGFIIMGHSLRHAGQPRIALSAAQSAMNELRPRSKKAGDVAWLFRILNDDAVALAIARSVADPAERAAALVQLATEPPTPDPYF